MKANRRKDALIHTKTLVEIHRRLSDRLSSLPGRLCDRKTGGKALESVSFFLILFWSNNILLKFYRKTITNYTSIEGNSRSFYY